MDISKIDKNFKINNNNIDGKLIKVPSEKVSLFGLFYDDDHGFYRMGLEAARKTSPNVSYLNLHTAGGRVCFKTNSQVIKIHVSYDCLEKMYHMPLTGQAGFSLNQITGSKQKHIQTFTLDFSSDYGYIASTRKLNGKKMRSYILYFPLYNKVKSLYIELEKGSIIKPFNPYKAFEPIVYYGSSITQGGCASRSDNSYQNFIERWTNIDFLNLGFSGNAKGEKEIADYIKELKTSLFVLDYDHNTPTTEHLQNTHEPLFKAFRETHPTTPVIMISAPNYYVDPDIYEPRRQVVENTYLNAIKNGDKNVYFIDGRFIYPSNLREYATVDDAHPNDLGFYLMAKTIYKVIKKNKLF